MKGKRKLILILVPVILLLAGGAWFFIHKSSGAAKPKELSADEIAALVVQTEPITTNLKSGGFIQFSFQMQTDNTKAKDELTKRDFQVRNIAIQSMSSVTQDQIQNPKGMAALEDQMKNQINKLMTDGKVVQIYTTNKVIQ
jgi:flagellar FliL protein